MVIQRWKWDDFFMLRNGDGDFVLFTDHEHVVAELRSALAAKSAEVEGLAKDAERYRWLKENCQAVADENATAGQLYFGTYLYGNIDSAIDAAMEKSNEHQDQ